MNWSGPPDFQKLAGWNPGELEGNVSQEFHFELPMQVRFRDIDAMGHVNNAVYFTYMEQARIDYMRAIGSMSDSLDETWFILAEELCQFKSPVPYGMPIVIQVRVSEMKDSSFVMEYRIVDRNTGCVMALGRTVNVAYDYPAGKSKPIPVEWRERIQVFERG